MPLIEFTIHVDDPEDVSILFDRIQVWRSATELGTYVDITANEETAAQIDGSVAGPWNLDGTSLTVNLNGADPQTIDFSGTDPIGLEATLDAINAVFEDLASEVPEDTAKIRLTSGIFGSPSILELSGSAAAILGLSTARTNGKIARLLLAATTEEYLFRDYDGQESYWYKTRYFNSTTGAVSAFSDARRGAPGEVIPSSSKLLCFVYLADGAGDPIVGRRVILVPTRQVQITNDDDQIYGVLSSVDRIVLTTNDSGYAEKNLVRGQTFKMFIEGTQFQREVTIPSTGTSLNLLTAASTADDPFTIVSTPPMPIRMS